MKRPMFNQMERNIIRESDSLLADRMNTPGGCLCPKEPVSENRRTDIMTKNRETLKHKFFEKRQLYWVRRRDGYRFSNEECGIAIDRYIESGKEP